MALCRLSPLLLGVAAMSAIAIVLFSAPLPSQADANLEQGETTALTPVHGLWAGTTDRSQPMSLTVSADGAQWMTFTLKTTFSGNCFGQSYGGETQLTVRGPGAIVENHFDYNAANFSFDGQFVTAEVAMGTYAFDQYRVTVGLGFPPYICYHYITEFGSWAAEPYRGTPTPTPTPSRTPTVTHTPTRTASATRTQTPTRTATATNSTTPSRTSTATLSPTASVTASLTPTPSHTGTPTVTLTPGHFRIYLPVILSAFSPPPTATATATPTPTATNSPTPNPNHVRSGWASSAPVIDGALSPGEWDRAGRITMQWGTVYLLNDAEKLYVAFDLTADTQSDAPLDSANLYFDAGQRGSLQEGSDPIISWSNTAPTGIAVMPFLGFWESSLCEWGGLPTVPNRAAATYSGHRRIELWAYLSEARVAGPSVGLWVYVLGLDQAVAGSWPMYGGGCDARTWGVLDIASAPG